MSKRVVVGLMMSLGLAGCASVQGALQNGRPAEEKALDGWAAGIPKPYQGEECGKVVTQERPKRKKAVEQTSLAEFALGAVCPRYKGVRYKGLTRNKKERFQEYVTLDPEHWSKPLPKYLKETPSPAHRALMALYTYEAPYAQRILTEGKRKHRADFKQSLGLAFAGLLATSDDAIRQDLTDGGVPSPVVGSVMENLAMIRADVSRLQDAYGPYYTQVYVNAPRDAIAAYDAYIVENAALLSQIDAARVSIESNPTAQAISTLETVRKDYLAKCGQKSCMYDMVYASATHALLPAYEKMGRERDLVYNTYLFSSEGSMVVGLPHMIRSTQMRQGMKAASAQGDVRFNSREHTFFGVRVAVPFKKRSAVVVSDKVATVKAKRGMVQVSPTNWVREITQRYGCKKTNRVIKIESDGRVKYALKGCKTRKKARKQEGFEPYLLSKAEAALIQPGDHVIVVIDSKDGDRQATLLEVRRAKQRVYSIAP